MVALVACGMHVMWHVDMMVAAARAHEAMRSQFTQSHGSLCGSRMFNAGCHSCAKQNASKCMSQSVTVHVIVSCRVVSIRALPCSITSLGTWHMGMGHGHDQPDMDPTRVPHGLDSFLRQQRSHMHCALQCSLLTANSLQSMQRHHYDRQPQHAGS